MTEFKLDSFGIVPMFLSCYSLSIRYGAAYWQVPFLACFCMGANMAVGMLQSPRLQQAWEAISASSSEILRSSLYHNLVSLHIHINTYIYIYTCIYVCYSYTYTYTYTYMSMCIYIIYICRLIQKSEQMWYMCYGQNSL